MSAALQQGPQFKLKLSVVKGPHAGQVFDLNKDMIVIGRGPENDVVLMNDPQVSRSHASIVLVERDFEIIKVSQKNAIMVDGESVDRWKLVNGSSFTIGDSEIKIEYDLGRAVATVPPKKLAEIIPLKSHEATQVYTQPTAPSPLPVKSNVLPPLSTQKARPTALSAQQKILLQQQQDQQRQRMAQQLALNAQAQAQRSAQAAASTSLMDNPRFRFYAIIVLVLGAFLLFMFKPNKVAKSSKAKPVLKYEDEINIKMNSTPEKELVKKREEKKQDRNSPQFLRAQENFIKGMRDYSLGNYLRAQEFFQVVLNLDSDNVLAKRHLLLSRIRFDELVQAKLMLGESYYSKHNFDMCLSMYQQVMNMLDDKKADVKYKLAERKAKECELASEGIR